ncbi:MAG: hypothetical protein HY390_07145 [Deltaproteobacteria bacterium]|nr:hypothetical protein [Deltaproteobacteria bacterium]
MKIQKMAFFLNTCLFLWSLSAQAGGNSSAGGTLFQATDTAQPILYDFTHIQTELPNDRRTPEDDIHISEFSERVGYDVFPVYTTSAFKQAEQRLELWKTNSPVIVNYILEALKNVRWLYTPFEFRYSENQNQEPRLENIFPNHVLRPAVIYLLDLGAWISAPTWNTLGDNTRAGILIHESLRHIQNCYGMLKSNEKLEKITATIMLTNPTPGTCLDSDEFLDDIILEIVKKNNELKQAKTEFQKNVINLYPGQSHAKIVESIQNRHKTQDSPSDQFVEVVLAANRLELFEKYKFIGEVEDIFWDFYQRFLQDGRVHGRISTQISEPSFEALHNQLFALGKLGRLIQIDLRTRLYKDVAIDFSRLFQSLAEDEVRKFVNEPWYETLGIEVVRHVPRGLTFFLWDPFSERSIIRDELDTLEEQIQQFEKDGIIVQD